MSTLSGSVARREPAGAPLVVHRLLPQDLQLVEGFLLGVDQDTRYNRFCGLMTDAAIRTYLRGARGRGAVLIGAFDRGRLCGVAELCPDSDGLAEAAFTVDRAARRRGIGSALMKAVLLAAGNRGFRVVRVVCLPGNRAMSRIAVKAGGRSGGLTTDQAVFEIPVERATPFSLSREFVADSLGRVANLLQPAA